MEFYLICLTLPFHHRTSRFYLLDTLYCCHLWNYLPGNLRTEDLSLSFIKKRCGDFYKKNSLRASSPEHSGGWAAMEEELATTSLEFEYLHRNFWCEMLIGGDDIRNDVIALVFEYCLHSRSFPLRAYWRKSDSSIYGEPQGNWRWNSNSKDVVASSPCFSCPAARAPRRACSHAIKNKIREVDSYRPHVTWA